MNKEKDNKEIKDKIENKLNEKIEAKLNDKINAIIEEKIEKAIDEYFSTSYNIPQKESENVEKNVDKEKDNDILDISEFMESEE